MKNPFDDSEQTLNIPQSSIKIDNQYLNQNRNSDIPDIPEPNRINVSSTKPTTPPDNQEPQMVRVEDSINVQDKATISEHTEHNIPKDVIMPPITKYHITDFYWLLNYNFAYGNNEQKNEPGLIVIGYNASFNNLRIEFYAVNPNSIQNNAIILHNCVKLTSVNIFSEIVEQVFDIIRNKSMPVSIPVIERLWKQQPNWIPNTSNLHIDNKRIILNTIDSKTQHQYTYPFIDFQYNALINSMKIMINGNAWYQSMISKINT